MNYKFGTSMSIIGLSLAALVGCGDDDGNVPQNTVTLTDAEYNSVNEAIGTAIGNGITAGTAKSKPQITSPRLETVDLPEESSDCEVSGHITQSGTVNYSGTTEEDFSGSFDFNFDFDQCVQNTEDSQQIGLDGVLNMKSSTFTAQSNTFSITIQGGLDVTGVAEEGVCAVDITVSYADSEDATTCSGTMCGRTVNENCE